MDETFDLSDEQDILPVLEVRVLNETKKTSYRVRRLTNFPVAENIQDMKAALELFMPDIQNMENWRLGYVLERNKKYTVETDVELQEAFQHFKDGYQMCLDPMPAKAVAPKRKNDTNAQGKQILSVYFYVQVFTKGYFCLLYRECYTSSASCPKGR